MKLRRRSRAADDARDRELWPHEYIGPSNIYGLAPGRCRIERKWAGGLIIRQPGGQRSTVAKIHVRPRA